MLLDRCVGRGGLTTDELTMGLEDDDGYDWLVVMMFSNT